MQNCIEQLQTKMFKLRVAYNKFYNMKNRIDFFINNSGIRIQNQFNELLKEWALLTLEVGISPVKLRFIKIEAPFVGTIYLRLGSDKLYKKGPKDTLTYIEISNPQPFVMVAVLSVLGQAIDKHDNKLDEAHKKLRSMLQILIKLINYDIKEITDAKK